MSGSSAVPPGEYRPPLPTFPASDFVFPTFVPRPPASGSRTAAGVVAIALAFIELVHFFPTWFVALAAGSGSFSVLAALLLVSALGNLAFGIAVLAGRRVRRRAAPMLLAGFAVMAIILCLVDVLSVGYTPDIWATSLVATLAPAVAVLVLVASSLTRKQADATAPD